MKECSYCGEFNKVRYIEYIECLFDRTGLIKGYSNICKKCDNAIKVKDKKIKDVYDKLNKREQKTWIKERDKLLK